MDENLLKALGKIKQKKLSVHQFVENIKDLVRQLASPPSNKSLRAWFLNGTSLRNLIGFEITNPTKSFEERVERALKMENKTTKTTKPGKRSRESSSSDNSSSSSSELSDSNKSSGSVDYKAEYKKLKKKYQNVAGVRSKMPKRGEVWCVHCRTSDHCTPDCLKCDYCKRRGHEWEDCDIRRLAPAVRLAAPAGQDNFRPP